MKENTLNYISYGMYALTFKENDKIGGCIINTFSQVTSQDEIITVNLNKNNYSNEVIKRTKKFAINILSEDIDRNIIANFGFRSSRDTDKFQDVNYFLVDDLPIIDGSINGYIICEIIDIVDCGTHDIIIAKVINKKSLNEKSNPMTYKYYHEVIKGKAPKNAPTYQKEEILTTEKVYVCELCGYEYVGDIPSDFVCPICKATREYFKEK